MGNTNSDGLVHLELDVQKPLCEPLELRKDPSKGLDGIGSIVSINEKG